jgi:hypothetical protein
MTPTDFIVLCVAIAIGVLGGTLAWEAIMYEILKGCDP